MLLYPELVGHSQSHQRVQLGPAALDISCMMLGTRLNTASGKAQSMPQSRGSSVHYHHKTLVNQFIATKVNISVFKMEWLTLYYDLHR